MEMTSLKNLISMRENSIAKLFKRCSVRHRLSLKNSSIERIWVHQLYSHTYLTIYNVNYNNHMLDQFYSGKAERDRVMQQTRDLHRFIKNEREKNERKLKKHQQTIKKAKRAPALQKKGELLTAHMHLVSQGDSEVTVVDYYD